MGCTCRALCPYDVVCAVFFSPFCTFCTFAFNLHRSMEHLEGWKGLRSVIGPCLSEPCYGRGRHIWEGLRRMPTIMSYCTTVEHVMTCGMTMVASLAPLLSRGSRPGDDHQESLVIGLPLHQTRHSSRYLSLFPCMLCDGSCKDYQDS